MSFITSWLNRFKNPHASHPNREEAGEGDEVPSPDVTAVPVKDLVEVTAVPKHLLDKVWGIAEIDLPLSHLGPEDFKWIQWKIEIIARGGEIVAPEEPHPVFYRILKRYHRGDIDLENISLWGYVRARRALYGHERSLAAGINPRLKYM